MKKFFLSLIIITLAFFSCKKAEEKVPEEPVADAEEKVEEPLFTAELGIAPYTFRNSFPNGIAETLDTIQQLGFTEIEGGGHGMEPEAYKKLCEERGLSIPAIGAGYEQLVKDPMAIVNRAKIIGAKYVMAAWIPHDTGNLGLEDAKKAVNDFNTVGKVLADNYITFCYHAHVYEFKPHEDGTLLDYIMENTKPEHVSFEMDIFWIHFGGGDPAALLRKYPDRWKLMHLKDMKKGTEKDLTGLTEVTNDVAIGTGELDIPEILKAAKEIGIAHYFIEDESPIFMQQIPKSIEYLKSLKE